MAPRLLADLVVLAHLAFILFAVFGGLLVLRWRRCLFLHLPALAWAAVVEFTGSICPLTPLENRLRLMGGRHVYETGFIEYYVLPLIYPEALPRSAQVGLGLALLAVNAAIYLLVWHRRTRPDREPRRAAEEAPPSEEGR